MSNIMGIYVKFTKTTHQVWSCQVFLTSDSEKFYFSPDSVLNFRKSYQFGVNWLKNKKLQAKTIWGWKTPPPPVLIGLRLCKVSESACICYINTVIILPILPNITHEK